MGNLTFLFIFGYFSGLIMIFDVFFFKYIDTVFRIELNLYFIELKSIQLLNYKKIHDMIKIYTYLNKSFYFQNIYIGHHSLTVVHRVRKRMKIKCMNRLYEFLLWVNLKNNSQYII